MNNLHAVPAASVLRMDLPMSAVEQVPLGVTRVDLEGNFTFANGRMLRIAGLDTWVGKTVRDLFVDDDLTRVLDGLKRREQREGDSYEVVLTRPSGLRRRVPISITAFPETDAHGKVIGTLGLVRDLSLERAAETMVKAIEESSTTEALLDAVREALRPLVPFDLLQVLRLNAAGTHMRTIYPPSAVARRFYRWWRIPDVLRHMLNDRQMLTINDLSDWYQVQRRLGLPLDGAIEQFLADGFTATMNVPVFHEGKQVAGIVLCRKGGAGFSDEEREIADKLPLAEAVSVAQRNETQGDLEFLLALMHNITAAYDSVQSVAQTVVDRIAAHYRWDYVSIHQVDKPGGTIRLIAQRPRSPEFHSNREEIPIEHGVVGHVHRTGTPVLTGDIENDSDLSRIFVRHRQTVTCSELCVPIGQDANWLLNVEDSKTEAFCPEDKVGLQTIADSLDALLRRTLEYNYRSAIVRNASDAILLVDESHVVFEANEAARALLQLKTIEEIKGRLVTDFMQDKEHAAVLLAGESFPNHSTFFLRGTSEATTPVQVLLSVARLPRETPGRVFIASDLSQFVRGDELALARDLFREITGQIKTPMSLAISWLRRFSAQARSAAGDVPDKVLQQLQKAELTLDRMLLIERGQAAPHYPTLLPFDDFMVHALEDLPERERDTVDRQLGAPDAWVRADGFELRYCVQTVLTYLLRLAANASGIALRTQTQGNFVKLEIRGGADAMSASQIDVQCRAGQAVAELSLGSQTLSDLARRNGGHYEEYRSGESASFVFIFPRAPSGDAS